ncbi:hypothetical protein AX17_004592 [Amanita inopinata Kibby_2008]|nr:hypothetical protein AX17_004592 [Amanita inopinata Kibby_2008]
MSRSSTNSTPKIPTQLPSKSAWLKGPPQTTSVPSPRSQSPAPSTPVHATHSRRPSTLGQGVPVKDGVSVPRNNVGAVKQGSAVTFGSIDDVSAPISSSPVPAPPIKSEGVKSFGSVPNTHVNGKASISSRPSAGPSNTSSSTPAVSATHSKTLKMDMHKFFQNPSSQPSTDTSSPSTRPSPLPSQSSSSQPSQAPSSSAQSSFTPFVPSSRPQQNTGPSGGPPRSPAYPRQLANGSGPRPPQGPSGGPPSQMSAGMSSPRLGTHPPSGMPPPPPPMSAQMQPPMQSQVPVGWPAYYYPGMPEQHYMQPYPGAWYPMPQQIPPAQHQHQHPPHHPPPGSHTSNMPMSPRNPPPPLQGPGTPTLPHATATSVPHPPPMSHAPSSSMSSISSPPPTPSSALPGAARLNANSTAFVPGGPPRKVIVKNPHGIEVDLESLKISPAPSTSSTSSATNIRQTAPGTPTRKPARLESEEQRRQRLEEEQKMKEKARAKADAEEKVKKEKEEEEKRRKEEEKKKKEEEEERKRKDEEEKEQQRIRQEEEQKERLRKEEEEKERLRKDEEEKARLRKEQEEKERLGREEEERKRKEEEEEQERIRLAEEKAREEEQCKREEEERKRARRQEEEEAAKAKAVAEAEAVSKMEKSKMTEGEITQEPEEGEISSMKEEPKERSKEGLRIDTVLSEKRRPGPLDLTHSRQPSSPLTLARHIEDLGSVTYPEGIMSPKPELNAGAKEGKFRYDRDFLLQFMSICKEKPESLPPLDAIGLEPVDQLMLTRGGSGRHRQISGTSVPSRQASIGGGIPGAGLRGQFQSMGSFTTSSSKFVPGGERFDSAGNRSVSMSGASMSFRNAPLQRTASQGGPGPMQSHRTRSKRGEKRPDSKGGVGGGPQAHGPPFGHGQPSMLGINFEPVVPLQMSENRWDRKALHVIDPDSPEVVDRKVKALLNKLTMERFDSISDQIIQWANKSEKEKDGRTLIQVIRLVFEKATDEATWSEMYARLCRKMMEQISPKVQDDGIKNSEGKPIAGGQLFRKYLLNRCQEDFEHGWVAKEAAAAAAATKALEDQAVKAANEKGSGEIALYSEEYYVAQKAKRQGLGLIKFIGELFKLQMLTERIMHECVKKLLGNVHNPEEEEIESLCKLLSTVGSLLDTQKARAHMDVYFQRMRELTLSLNVNPRMQFMLQDVIELRERKWVARNVIAAPTTLAQVHEAAAKEKAAQEKESSQRISMSRGGSRRGGARDEYPQPGPDGWTVTGNASRASTRAGDLSQFGRISKAQPITTFGPSSVFAGKKEVKRESLSRTNSSSNMFLMLSQSAELTQDASSKEAPQRRKLMLQPRSKPLEEPTRPAGENVSPSEEEAPAAAEMTEDAANAKIAEDIKEFFHVRNLDEAEVYFATLPAHHHHRLVDKMTAQAVESKEADAQLVADLFMRAKSKGLCSTAAFEEGFTPTAEAIEDIAIDAPKAWTLFATMVKGAELDEEHRTRLASKSTDSDKLLGLLSS